MFYTFKDAEKYFYGKENHFWDFGLDNIKDFLFMVGRPQEKLKIIQIAGTNGKGSVSAFLSQILIESGYKTGRYNSPVVFNIRENISINDESMSEDDFIQMTSYMYEAMEKSENKGKLPTVFELETAMALCYFAEKKCDIVVLETGLGGKTDATNVSEKNIMSVFTSVGIDHTEYLGKTIEEITKVKAGIIKPYSLVISGFNEKKVTEILRAEAEKNNSIFINASADSVNIIENNIYRSRIDYKKIKDIEIPLAGCHQIDNAVIAIRAALALKEQGYNIDEKGIKKGIKQTRWPGRFELISENPMFIIDGAHNENAAQRLAENIRNYLKGKKIILIMGIFEDKDYVAVIECMKEYMGNVICVRTSNKRSMSPEKLKSAILQRVGMDKKIHTADTIKTAVKTAYDISDKDSAIVAFGSLSHLKDIKIAVEQMLNDNSGEKITIL